MSFWQMLPPPPSREAACVKQDLGVSVQVPACSAQLTASIPTGTRRPRQQHGKNRDRPGGTYACVPGTYPRPPFRDMQSPLDPSGFSSPCILQGKKGPRTPINQTRHFWRHLFLCSDRKRCLLSAQTCWCALLGNVPSLQLPPLLITDVRSSSRTTREGTKQRFPPRCAQGATAVCHPLTTSRPAKGSTQNPLVRVAHLPVPGTGLQGA